MKSGLRGRVLSVIGIPLAAAAALVFGLAAVPLHAATLAVTVSILPVPPEEIRVMLAIAVGVVALVGGLYQPFLAMSYDEEFARIRGVPVTLLYFLLVAIVAVAVVMVIQVVGLILVIALLTIPPFIVERHCRSLATMMAGSVALGTLFTLTGLWLAYALNLTSGAAIILVAGAGFGCARLVEAVRGRRDRTRAAPTAD